MTALTARVSGKGYSELHALPSGVENRMYRAVAEERFLELFFGLQREKRLLDILGVYQQVPNKFVEITFLPLFSS